MPKRLAREIEVRRERLLDERLWPILFCLALLTALTMGTIAAYLPFGRSPWYADAWTYMVLLPIVAGLAALWIAFVDTQARHRTLQLAAVLCLLFHLALIVATLETYLFRDYSVTTRGP